VATVAPGHDIVTLKSCLTAGDWLHYIVLESHNADLEYKTSTSLTFDKCLNLLSQSQCSNGRLFVKAALSPCL